MTRVEILAIGDELLRGIVQESNSHWLSLRIAARGAVLQRVTLVPDEPAVVAEEIRASLTRAPALVITHGGLGPTDDDRTREAIALGTGRPQERNDAALAIIRRRYEELAADGRVPSATPTPERERMADLPRGAEPLDNHVGTAPAIKLTVGATTIVALPGVPPELFWIWEHSLAPTLDHILGRGGFAEVTLETDLHDESIVAAALERIQAAHPDVYVKSRARGFGTNEEVRVTVHARAPSDEEARRRVDRALADVRATLTAAGVAFSG